MAPITRAGAKRFQDFPKFMEMPPEVRLMVWKEAMPDYGIVPVTFEFKDGQGREINHVRFVVNLVYRTAPTAIALALPPRETHTPAFLARHQTIRALLNTCYESRLEVQSRFPHSVPSRGGELRFHGAKDIITLTDIPFTEIRVGRFGRQPPVFSQDWNKLPHKISFSNPRIRVALHNLFSSSRSPPWLWSPAPGAEEVRRLQAFLSNLPNLGQVFLTASQSVTSCVWNRTKEKVREQLAHGLGECYPSGVISGHIIRDGMSATQVSTLTRNATNLRRVFHGDPAAPENVPWNRHIKFGLPQLRGVEVLSMVNVDPELEWLCKKIPSE